ncbi:phosphoribosyl-dephospho-CoA transferase MdcG domain-containing protein [Pusillimonas sp.]|uniref:phosphoribosyl-dephospho-CoA transferase MdcG domain-containing protein n=1 Tax=Pusillimonas sp. TaxID=3040095 RepID=UPI0029BA3AA1|nr:phosphoribosyl-dephospho-CoA transferase MdcG domain-containing protein [Pusillimonas sp.]MDX3895093.1 malonate decarboxylase holo-[acyl-carrier-protein] synthase [Pusillimonas sp.]
MPGPRDVGPHDLVWVADPAGLHWRGGMPEWCGQWLRSGAPTPVVLRREDIGDESLLPVGIRGTQRHERQAAYLERRAIARVMRPEELVSSAGELVSSERAAWLRNAPRAVRPQELTQGEKAAMHPRRIGPRQASHDSAATVLGPDPNAALLDVFPAMAAIGLPWGPTGGLGFALATGLPVLHEGSDIDLLVRAPAPLSQGQVRALAAVVERSERPVDLQIDTGQGGFSFKEWAGCDPQRAGPPHGRGGLRRVLLKTGAGPVLVQDPWRPDTRAFPGDPPGDAP